MSFCWKQCLCMDLKRLQFQLNYSTNSRISNLLKNVLSTQWNIYSTDDWHIGVTVYGNITELCLSLHSGDSGSGSGAAAIGARHKSWLRQVTAPPPTILVNLSIWYNMIYDYYYHTTTTHNTCIHLLLLMMWSLPLILVKPSISTWCRYFIILAMMISCVSINKIRLTRLIGWLSLEKEPHFLFQ